MLVLFFLFISSPVSISRFYNCCRLSSLTTVFNFTYYTFCDNLSRISAKFLLSLLLLLCLFLKRNFRNFLDFVYSLLYRVKGENIVGYTACTCTLLYYASPLTTLSQVTKMKSFFLVSDRIISICIVLH